MSLDIWKYCFDFSILLKVFVRILRDFFLRCILNHSNSFALKLKWPNFFRWTVRSNISIFEKLPHFMNIFSSSFLFSFIIFCFRKFTLFIFIIELTFVFSSCIYICNCDLILTIFTKQVVMDFWEKKKNIYIAHILQYRPTYPWSRQLCYILTFFTFFPSPFISAVHFFRRLAKYFLIASQF